MTARLLLLWVWLLPGGAIPARADLKITTCEYLDHGSVTETHYVQGRNWRMEFGEGYGNHEIIICRNDVQDHNAACQRYYRLDPAARAYTVRRVEPHKPLARHAVESGKTLTIYFDTVDTGERRWMFGHLARHVIQSERRVSEPGSCSGDGDRRIRTDGWYIDLPGAYPGRPALPAHRAAYLGIGSARCAGMIDHIEFHETGPWENGFALLETRTDSISPDAQDRREVTELVEAPLDGNLFVPPSEFHLVLFLPGQWPYGFMNTIRSGWASLVSTAEALLD